MESNTSQALTNQLLTEATARNHQLQVQLDEALGKLKVAKQGLQYIKLVMEETNVDPSTRPEYYLVDNTLRKINDQ